MTDGSDRRPGHTEPPEDDPLARLVEAARPDLHELVVSYGLDAAQTVEVVRSAILAVMLDGVPHGVEEGRRRLLKLAEGQCRALWREEDEDDSGTTS